jgi:hypothetical protein
MINDEMEKRWGEKLRSFGFRHIKDEWDCAYHSSPDGVYFCFMDSREEQKLKDVGLLPTDLQLVVVGAMKQTPFELAMMIGKGRLWVKSAGGLPPAPELSDALKSLIYGRGFWQIILRDERAESAPKFELAKSATA